MNHRKTGVGIILAALALGASGSIPSMTSAPASVTASRSASLTASTVKRQAPATLKGSLYRASTMFAHSSLNQRQRRKFNRQRNAGGDRKAFA